MHGGVYRMSGGRIGSRLGGLPHLLLTTVGRKSGRPRTVPLAYMEDGEAWVLVASNGGADHHPAWWLNLCETPHAHVQLGADEYDVIAVDAEGAEYDRLWRTLKSFNPFYAQYEKITDRRIPIVILQRAV